MVTSVSQRPRAWVVYESMFGNTQRIAFAIADGLREAHDVVLHEVSEAPDVVTDDVVLLVVGGPTHGFALSTPQSREQAKKQADGEVISARRGLREWLDIVELQGRPSAVVFDTKVGRPKWFWGSAARRARKLLEEKGAVLLGRPQSFYVHFKAARPNELLFEGEVDRARAWGRALAPAVTSSAREGEGRGGAASPRS